MIWILIVAAVLTGLSAFHFHRRIGALRTDIKLHQAELQKDETRANAEQAVLRAIKEAARTNAAVHSLMVRHGIRPQSAQRTSTGL